MASHYDVHAAEHAARGTTRAQVSAKLHDTYAAGLRKLDFTEFEEEFKLSEEQVNRLEEHFIQNAGMLLSFKRDKIKGK